MNNYTILMGKLIKRQKDGTYKCILHPHADINVNGYYPSCEECVKELNKERGEEKECPMLRTRPYRKFEPKRK